MDASLRVDMAVFNLELSIDHIISNITLYYDHTFASLFHLTTMVDVGAIDNGSGIIARPYCL